MNIDEINIHLSKHQLYLLEIHLDKMINANDSEGIELFRSDLTELVEVYPKLCSILLERIDNRYVQFAIYFLIQDDKVVYVGQSINLRSRIASHVASDKEFDRVEYICVNSKEEMDIVENHFISSLKPKYNSACHLNMASQFEGRFNEDQLQRKEYQYGSLASYHSISTMVYKHLKAHIHRPLKRVPDDAFYKKKVTSVVSGYVTFHRAKKVGVEISTYTLRDRAVLRVDFTKKFKGDAEVIYNRIKALVADEPRIKAVYSNTMKDAPVPYGYVSWYYSGLHRFERVTTARFYNWIVHDIPFDNLEKHNEAEKVRTKECVALLTSMRKEGKIKSYKTIKYMKEVMFPSGICIRLNPVSKTLREYYKGSIECYSKPFKYRGADDILRLEKYFISYRESCRLQQTQRNLGESK